MPLNSATNNVYQQFQLSSGENHSSPVFFNNTVYIGPTSSALLAFPVSNAKLATSPSSQSSHTFGGNGTVYIGTKSSVAVFGLLH